MLPHPERSLFNLPLHLQRKQGNQQLQLWIECANLLFESYKDVPICRDQQRSITQWLQEWTPMGTREISTSTNNTSVNVQHLDWQSTEDNENVNDDNDVCHNYSQTNLANWLKSWGQEEESTGHNLFDQNNIDTKGEKVNKRCTVTWTALLTLFCTIEYLLL
jgi:hypothetical protein